MAVAVILGSAFGDGGPPGVKLVAETVATPFGPAVLHRVTGGPRPAFVLFRHGSPHTFLPPQIPYRAHAWALREVGVRSLLVTSSVGVLDAAAPLNRLLPVGDLLMPDNRLPDGSTCTMWPTPAPGQGHLVLGEGLFSRALTAQVAGLAALGPPVVFAYVGGPRTKTPAENRLWARWGAQVNSMTLGPEVVLAGELGIACAGVVVGHKYSHPDIPTPDAAGVRESLAASRAALGDLVAAFLRRGRPVAAGNHLYRFDESLEEAGCDQKT